MTDEIKITDLAKVNNVNEGDYVFIQQNGAPVWAPRAQFGSGEVIVPSYWKSALETGVDAINTAIENAGRNKSSFLFYSDTHWGYGACVSPSLLKYLVENTAINKVNFGGDFVNTYEEPNTGKTKDEWLEKMREWRKAIRGLNHHSVIGNHDCQTDIPYLNNTKHLYGFLMAPEETDNIVRGGDFDYYIDDPNEKTRYLYLSTGKFSVTDDEAAFVIESLKSTPANWHIVVISHIWFIYNDTNTPTIGSVPSYCQKLLNLFDAYNSREAGSVTMESTEQTYDFSNCGGKVEFCIGGHIHVDHSFTSQKGIPVILVETDSYHLRGTNSTREEGTITEASVSGIVADYDNSMINIIRVGRGKGKTIYITEIDASYTNVLNSVGYSENKRISTSSNFEERDNEGTDLSGYIPVKTGDILRLRNITMPLASSGYNCLVYYYDSDKVGQGSFNTQNIKDSSSLAGVFDASGNLIQFTANSDGYYRINAGNIDSNSIITINEEI